MRSHRSAASSPPAPRGIDRRCSNIFGFQHVAPDHRQRRWRLIRRRLLDDVRHPRRAAVDRFTADDSVSFRFRARHVFYGEHVAAAARAACFDQLPDHRLLGVDQIVGKNDGEWLITDDRFGAQHGMSQPERLGLAV